jgi:acyl-homoserine lactone synthase
MDVHVVTSDNAYLYGAELDGFFRARHKIYVEEKKWMPASADGWERDQFDTKAATYMIGVDNGRVIAGSRFLPTSGPHLLGEIFPHLCTLGGVLSDARVAEWTRGFILPEFRGGEGVPVMAQFCCAVMEYCLDESISRVGGIQEIYWLPLWRRFGWNFLAIGEPSEIDGTLCVPGYCEVSEEALAGVKRRAKLDKSNLIRRGPVRPFLLASEEEKPLESEDEAKDAEAKDEKPYVLDRRWNRLAS